MTMHNTLWYQIPAETATATRAAFPKGNRYVTLYDHLGPLFANSDFADLYVHHGRPAESPARLAMVLVLAHLEDLTDIAAADAVRARLDWKYLLALPLDDPGFDASILVDFRARLLAHGAETRLLTTLLETLETNGVLKARGRQRTDSTHVLAHMRERSRVELVMETMRATLNDLVDVAPAWLRHHVQPAWADRYARAADEYRLPKASAERLTLTLQVGRDGLALLTALDAADAPKTLRERVAVQTLRTVWAQQYETTPTLRWRATADLPPQADRINSPYEREARFATKRDTSWTGYKVHVTETCDDDTPHLITDVQTTPATTADSAMTTVIQQQLAERGLLPREHVLDSGYVSAAALETSERVHQVALLGPAPQDTSWQARQPDGLDITTFTIDWDSNQATCPQGATSVQHRHERVRTGSSQRVHVFVFAEATCAACPLRARCTRADTAGRTIKVREPAQVAALQAARERQTSEAFGTRYAVRAGIEGTLAQGVRAFGLRASRYTNQAKTHLQHILIAVAINLVRLAAWWNGDARRTTRQSAFARFMATTSEIGAGYA
jgi:transposase